MIEQVQQLLSAGRLADAQKLLQEVLSREPEHLDALQWLGITYQLGNDQRRALEQFDRAIAIQPSAETLHYNRGNSLLHVRRFDESADAYRAALRCNPKFFEAQQNLASALMLAGRTAAAAKAFAAAIDLSPQSAEAHNNFGVTLKDLGRLDEAIASFRRAIELKPEYLDAHSNLLYALHFHPACDAATILAEHRAWAGKFADPFAREAKPFDHDRSPDRRLRIGYVSPDLREHPVGRSVLPILLNRDRDHFDVICYSDGTTADNVTQRLRAAATKWEQINRLSDAALAELVRHDQIDILVDLTLHMNRNRLLAFARRPAPVQATFLAYPATSGVSQIDYRVTDNYLDPRGDTEQFNAEQLVRLQHSFWCYAADGDEPEVNELPALSRGFVTFGSLNNPAKINATVVELWARIVMQTESSRLLLFVNDREPINEHALNQFAAHGVDRERISFVTKLPRLEYLRRHQEIDIALDPFPYNGHMTSCDALYMGVPVVSLRGATSVARGGVSLLTNLQLTELLADSPEQYVHIATMLANDLPHLSNLRRTLRPRMRQSPLMDGIAFAGDLDRLYRDMWRRWCAR